MASLPLIQAITALIAASIASVNLSISLCLVPRLLELPAPLMIRLWADSHRQTGRVFFPVTMLACGFSYVYLAYQHGHLGNSSSSSSESSSHAQLLASAAVLCFSIVPWSQFLMTHSIYIPLGRLIQLVEKVPANLDDGEPKNGDGAVMTAAQEESARLLVKKWAVYNLGRGFPVLVAGAIGVFTLV